MAEIETLLVQFDADITEAELPLLRGAVIHATQGKDVLFHNHIGDNYRYAYPLVQYKCIDGKAAIFGLGDGVAAVEQLLADDTACVVRIGHRYVDLALDEMKRQTTDVRVSDAAEYVYSIHKYFPLNQENYRKYIKMDSIVERCSLIEKCVVGNILSFAKSVGIFFEDRLKVTLTNIKTEHLYQYKQIKMMGFNLSFKANVVLPDFMGLGKDVSLGSGTLIKQ